MSKIGVLLQTLYKYYPIGTPGLSNEQYPGFQALKKIQKQKFQQIFEEKNFEPWQSMEQEMKQLSTYSISTTLPSKAPHTHCFFSFDHQEQLYFHILISLLGPFYTSYYMIRHQTRLEGNIKAYGHTIYKTQADLLEENPQIDFDVNALVKKYAPDYEHISHHFLMSFMIKCAAAYDFPESKRDESPIYDFFFNRIHHSQAIILR